MPQKAKTKLGKRRFNLEFSDQENKDLEELTALLGSASTSETLRRAVKTCLKMCKSQNEGSVLRIHEPDGSVRELLLVF
jgi:hypothetical protein